MTAAPPDRAERLLTVGIPVFNGKSLLRNCLHSVVSSTLSRDRFEVVVADDGSWEPETREILREFEESLAADPGFFRVISLGTNSGGAARPRNRILDEAVGAYVFFVDADDTIGSLALERVADALASTPADWVALHQVPVNGRSPGCEVLRPRAEVPRVRALTTLTVHKVFRRAEIERQHLRFDEGLPSGQDVAFAFSFLLRAERFLMLGGYDYYYLTQHAENPNEPEHLSRRARTPEALIEKNERILRSMMTDLRTSTLPEAEQRTILVRIVLPRLLLQEGYLRAVADVGPEAGPPALRRLSALLAGPLLADVDPAGHKGLTREHLTTVADADWAGLGRLVRPTPRPASRGGSSPRWRRRARRLVDLASGRARHRRVLVELDRLRRSVEDLHAGQRRLEADLQAGLQRRDDSAGGGPSGPVGTPSAP